MTTAHESMLHQLVRSVTSLGQELRWSYLPPLMVYMAAGVSGLTSIVGTFFIKEYLGLSAAFLATLGFWAGLPWALKMPFGHLVDLLWRFKGWLVVAGASLIAASLIIMVGLVSHTDAMRNIASVETWFVISVLLAPVGYVMQDAVADAMTVEAVPTQDGHGQPLEAERIRLMHTTMQTLGRIAIIGGTLLVSLINVIVFADVDVGDMTRTRSLYGQVYAWALVIPVLSVSGVVLGAWHKRRQAARMRANGVPEARIRASLFEPAERIRPSLAILGGSAAFVAITLGVGLSGIPFGAEIIFIGSLTIILLLIRRLLTEISPQARNVLIGTAIIVFMFRALPGPGAGATWWMIDELGFDQAFLSKLALLASTMTLLGLFLFRRYMATHSIAAIVVMLTLVGTLLSLPILGMYHGLHEWTAALTGGIVDARFIALVDTALESPLGQIAMVPMLAWIANSAPAHMKATFFAVMSSFTNLALSASQLGTRYLNEWFTVTREVRDPAGIITTPADYSELGMLLATVTLLGLIVPLLAVWAVRRSGLGHA